MRISDWSSDVCSSDLELGQKRYLDPDSLTLWERLQNLAVDFLVRRKVRRRFGGRIKAIVSGGAALNYDIGLSFTALGLPLLHGHGQTETPPVVSANPPWKVKLDTAHPTFAGAQVTLAEDGDTLVRGELVPKGPANDQ